VPRGLDARDPGWKTSAPVSRSLTRITALAAVALAALVALAAARTPIRPARTAGCHLRLALVAHGQGSPDDLAWDGHTLLVSDINGGTVGVVAHGHVRTLVAHIREPEGIVPGPGHSIIVAEQATNRVLEIQPTTGRRRVLARLPLPMGKSGIDGINADGSGAVFIPDSARGRLYVLHLRSGKLTEIARGMNRPVAAINWHHAVVVADEYAGQIWRIGRPRRSLGSLPLPDDLAVVSNHLLANSLAGQVYEVAPHLRLLSSAFRPTVTDPQGMVADGSDAVLVADEGRNAIYRLSQLSGCL
jgi:hypothetical protein